MFKNGFGSKEPTIFYIPWNQYQTKPNKRITVYNNDYLFFSLIRVFDFITLRMRVSVVTVTDFACRAVLISTEVPTEIKRQNKDEYLQLKWKRLLFLSSYVH